ncbi:queuosine qued: queuosine biosynthesis protein qued [Lucifera butyrica]|uniref:6-carboxy-5,6,7,8-tetrahydropterin synthase n=1 Tax=Lucifera butyrica TaxID=1351585 RepID=A0A498RAB4_9FIRM|nr:6-carboxytetrahydropterin synthase QueD [Lucifera butyrica]VBB07915.1 queuosine qued: queuosine biosynthesis protein qued [Lucifera butyrica]
MFELTITTDFEAAHRIPEYPGKCQRLHGHNWKVEVAVSGEGLDHLGMLVDFRVLKQEVAKVIATLDHYYLNELAAFQTICPTAENIACHIYKKLVKSASLPAAVTVSYVKVWESPYSAVSYREGGQ